MSGIWRSLCKAEPQLEALERIVGAQAVQVWPGSSQLHYLGRNCLVELRFGSGTQAQAVVLATATDLFAGNTRIRLEEMPSFSLLGLRHPFSAADLLARLNELDPRAVATLNEFDHWKIIYGGAYIFQFRPIDQDIARDPGCSELITLEYNYGPRFSGAHEVHLESGLI